MTNIINPSGNELIKVVLKCPNASLLTGNWDKLFAHIRNYKNEKDFVERVREMARAYGDINRNYSKNLPEKYFLVLQKRCTELRRVVQSANKRKKRIIIPLNVMEGWFSGKESF